MVAATGRVTVLGGVANESGRASIGIMPRAEAISSASIKVWRCSSSVKGGSQVSAARDFVGKDSGGRSG
jgi:hypothetical protein